MEKLYSPLALTAFLFAIVVLAWYTLRQLRERKREDETPDLGEVAAWHITHTRANTNFNFVGTYRQAVAELRSRVVDATIVHVDHEWHVILFDFPAKK